jgi:hypothetical protein
VPLLRRWEDAYPETLRFWRHGGFGFITFTPWTTIADLRVNVEGLEWLSEFYPIPSLSYCSRVQLLPARALTLLARRDGLLAPTFADAAFDSGCITCLDQCDLPWRFRDPAVARVYRLIRRVVGDAQVPEDDPDRRRVRAWFRGECYRRRRDLSLSVFRELVEVVAECPDEEDIDRLLAGVSARLERFPERISEAVVWGDAVQATRTPRLLALRTGLSRMLVRLRQEQSPLLAGLEVSAPQLVATAAGTALCVRLVDARGPVEVCFVDRGALPQNYAETQRLAVFHTADGAIDTRGKNRLVLALLHALSRLDARVAERETDRGRGDPRGPGPET